VAALEGYGIEIVEHIPIPSVNTPRFDSPQGEAEVGAKLVGAFV
jgi:hypothetical protein